MCVIRGNSRLTLALLLRRPSTSLVFSTSQLSTVSQPRQRWPGQCWRNSRCRTLATKENDESERLRQNVTVADIRRKRIDKGVLGWKSALIALAVGVFGLAVFFLVRQKRWSEQEKRRRAAVGKSLIGGEWELVNQDGLIQGTKDFLGNWILMYFGFTHCPDICPDELDKMVKVANMLEEMGKKEKKAEPILPIFISVDPERDTPAIVKGYIKDFSPKLIGFTGDKEQVDKVTKTFRVYHSKGPKNPQDDYIVDHTVIMYLIDPEGKFLDYYGQNRTAEEIAEVIQLQQLKYKLGKDKGWW